MKESAATKHVMRNLQKGTPSDPWGSVGEHFHMDSVESYRSEAMAWLKENSELSTRTIESADYSVALEHFKKFE